MLQSFRCVKLELMSLLTSMLIKLCPVDTRIIPVQCFHLDYLGAGENPTEGCQRRAGCCRQGGFGEEARRVLKASHNFQKLWQCLERHWSHHKHVRGGCWTGNRRFPEGPTESAGGWKRAAEGAAFMIRFVTHIVYHHRTICDSQHPTRSQIWWFDMNVCSV